MANLTWRRSALAICASSILAVLAACTPDGPERPYYNPGPMFAAHAVEFGHGPDGRSKPVDFADTAY